MSPRGLRLRPCALSRMDRSANWMRLVSFPAAISAVLAIFVLSDTALAFVAPIVHSSRSSTSKSSSTTATCALRRVRLQQQQSPRVLGIMSSSATSTEQDSARKENPSPPAIVKGVLFDMDGTLTDSDTLHFEAYRETFLKASTRYQAGCTHSPSDCRQQSLGFVTHDSAAVRSSEVMVELCRTKRWLLHHRTTV